MLQLLDRIRDPLVQRRLSTGQALERAGLGSIVDEGCRGTPLLAFRDAVHREDPRLNFVAASLLPKQRAEAFDVSLFRWTLGLPLLVELTTESLKLLIVVVRHQYQPTVQACFSCILRTRQLAPRAARPGASRRVLLVRKDFSFVCHKT